MLLRLRAVGAMLQDRGFVLTHQKVALELSFQDVLAGYTEITVSPTTPALRAIFLIRASV